MNNIQAFANGQANKNKEMMVFNWDKAAKLIKEHNGKEVWAGLKGDWNSTGGLIFEDGKPCFCGYTYLASTWAIPEIDIDGMIYECYSMQSDVSNWDAKTKWPKSALEELNCVFEL